VIIPKTKLPQFVRELCDHCSSTRQDRKDRGDLFVSYYATGSDDDSRPAFYNKVYSALDDLESMLFSPISLRFEIGDPDIPNVLNEAKNRAAASRIRTICRETDLDTLISQAVTCALVKGVGITKTMFKKGFHSSLVQPEAFGVFRENHNRLDTNMEAFVHTIAITKHQFERMIWNSRDREELRRQAKAYMRPGTGLRDTSAQAMSIIVGGLYPFNASGGVQGTTRGVVEWMSQPRPQLAPNLEHEMMLLDELWVWDDHADDWACFQIIGDKMLILGRYFTYNPLSYDPINNVHNEELKGCHPFNTFTVNPLDDYFWGWSEIAKLMLLQEAINSRIIGVNKMLRKQEDPATKMTGVAGVNQLALNRFRKPGGYYTDANPNAKIENEQTQIPADIWGSIHECERMFDEMMGLPPVAKGQGEAGVRSAQHAETLVRMFSPRFKDRALLIERDVARQGALVMDMARAYDDKKLVAWAPEAMCGPEVDEDLKKFAVPPAKGFAPVVFQMGDLPDNVTLTVDAHSSSPAFSMEAKELVFALHKIGAMSASDVVEHVDAPDPDKLLAGITRREVAQAEALTADREAGVQKKLHGGAHPKH
jgi:hypothetical protein